MNTANTDNYAHSADKGEIAKTSAEGAEATLAALGMSGASAMPPMMDGLTSGKPRKKIHFSAISMVLAIAVAGGLLVGMRQLGIGPQKIFGATADVQAPEMGKTTAVQEQILAELNASRTENQIPVASVKKNPFKMIFAIGLPTETHVVAKPGVKEDPETAARNRMAARKLERDKAVAIARAGLKVQSVVVGSRPVARINGEVYRVGDVVSEYFTIKTISGRTVEFEVDDTLFTVDIAEGKGK